MQIQAHLESTKKQNVVFNLLNVLYFTLLFLVNAKLKREIGDFKLNLE